LASLGVSLDGRGSGQNDSVGCEPRHCASKDTLSESNSSSRLQVCIRTATMGIQETWLVEHGDLSAERSSPLQKQMDLGVYLLSSISHMSDNRGSVIDHQYVDSHTVVHDEMRLVWILGDYSPSMWVDEFLVKPLGLTNGSDTSQSYTQLQVFLLAFPDTFIIYSSTGRDSQLHGTWRFIRQRLPDNGYSIICSRIGEFCPRQSDEVLGVMESILSRGTEHIQGGDRFRVSTR
jgi:hypothetical protein